MPGLSVLKEKGAQLFIECFTLDPEVTVIIHWIFTFYEAGDVMFILYMKALTPEDVIEVALCNTVSLLVFKLSS